MKFDGFTDIGDFCGQHGHKPGDGLDNHERLRGERGGGAGHGDSHTGRLLHPGRGAREPAREDEAARAHLLGAG